MNLAWRFFVFLAFTFAVTCSHATEYRFYSAAGVKLPMIEFAQQFKQSNPTNSIVNDFDTAGAAESKFIADTQSACLITTIIRLEKALSSGVLKGADPMSLADTLGGIAFSGDFKPSVSNASELKLALLNAKSIAFSDPARGATVGVHFLEIIKKLEIEKEVLAKSTLAKDGVETMNLVMFKKVELGITQVSEIIQADAKTLLGPFPKEFELASRYAVWCRDPKEKNMAMFLNLMQSENGANILNKFGLRPVR
jgi:molybdate transport system substrate-binding protein